MPTLRQTIARALEIPIEDLDLPAEWSEVADKKLYMSLTINDGNGSNEQLATDKLNILLDMLMEERGLSLDAADVLVKSAWENLVEDTR
jgi:hypothetical protein